MSAWLRKVSLTAHVTSSVGWLGAVMVFLALAIAGMTGGDGSGARAAYIAMDLAAWRAILPLAIASLLSGVVQSLGTPWGLWRHHWVVAKLLLTIAATLLLLLHMRPIEALSDAAIDDVLALPALRGLRLQLVVNAGAAMLVLLVATALSVFKPRGLTKRGWRMQRAAHAA
ncbi:MAG: hypothetical protein WKG00_05005 [Polyangiaceae bacterium]